MYTRTTGYAECLLYPGIHQGTYVLRLPLFIPRVVDYSFLSPQVVDPLHLGGRPYVSTGGVVVASIHDGVRLQHCLGQ